MPRTAGFFAGFAALVALSLARNSETWLDLVPCTLCLWQRWPYLAIMLVAGCALYRIDLAGRVLWVAVALFWGNAVLASFHAGVEWGFWPNILTACVPSGPPAGSVDDLLRAMPTRAVPCEEAAIRFAGLSMAGWNAIYALACGVILALMLRKEPRR
jgi:disulfide bond formation protein DsbB